MNWTKSQNKAVRSLGKSVIVSGEPGSGKTEMLVERVCLLVEKDRATPDQILVVALTGRASKEIRHRVAKRLGWERAHRSCIVTMHSLCSRILRENAFQAGIDPRFTVLGGAKQQVLVNRVFDETIAARQDVQQLLEELGPDVVRASIHRRVGRMDIPVFVNPPAPFLETFNRCYRELLEIEDDGKLGEVISRFEPNLPRMLESAGRLVTEFDWRDLQRMKKFRAPLRAAHAVPPVKQQVQACRNALTDFMAACLDEPSSQRANLILDLAADFTTRYASAKSQMGALDYDDVLSKTVALLDDQTAQRYKDMFKYIILADAQDLSASQRQVIDAISRPRNVFAVENEKQAIFGFTHDEPSQYKEIERKPSIHLRENFRSRKGIIVFVNHLFKKVWDEEPDVRYQPLIPSGRFADKPVPDVEFALVSLIDREDAEQSRVYEAKAIAERILEMTGDTPLTHTKEDRAGKPVALGDIAILLRTTSGMHIYERVLGEYGIETCALSGRGLYDAPEVRDVLSLLMLVEDPTDEAARETVLKSPLKDMADKLPDARGRIADVLDEILERTWFDIKLLAMQGGRRRYANIRRLVEIARDFRGSLSDFVPYVREIGYQTDGDASEGNAVRIMTIHRAAGLEFPVVFLGDMSRRLGPEPGPYISHPDWGLAVQVRNPKTGEFETPLSYREIVERIGRDSMVEEKRLLYVAMTRAEEHLVLVGSSDFRGEYRSSYRETHAWAGWIERAFELGPGTPQGELTPCGIPVTLRFITPQRMKPPKPQRGPVLADRFAQELQEGRPIAISSDQSEKVAHAAIERCLREMPPPTRRIIRFSVSQVLDYLECPARYRMLHIIGMPEQGGEPPDDAEEREFSAADLGHLVHDLLSRLDFSQEIEPQLRGILPGGPLGAQALPLIQRFAAGPWCKEMSDAEQILKETPFEIVVADKVFAGRMDVLYHTKDGWTILDYKTGRAETRERYELQVGMYAHVTHRLLGEMPSRAALLLLSTGEEWVQDTSDGAAASLAAEKIQEVAVSIDSGDFVPKQGKHCKWCSLAASCRPSA